MLTAFKEMVIATFQDSGALMKFLTTGGVSFIPVIELRGGIPVGYAMGLEVWQCFIAAVIGNMLPIPFILLFLNKFFAFCRKHIPVFERMISALERKAEKNVDKVRKYKKWGLFVFVAIPLPGTGAWTGALVASFLEMDFKEAMISIFAGVVGAGLIVTLLTYGVFDQLIRLF